MKTPKQVRDDIRTLTIHLNQVRDALVKRSGISVAQIGKECGRTAEALGELLKAQELPEDYKVAVVGRFKTGKSSFVNELLGARLASEMDAGGPQRKARDCTNERECPAPGLQRVHANEANECHNAECCRDARGEQHPLPQVWVA